MKSTLYNKLAIYLDDCYTSQTAKTYLFQIDKYLSLYPGAVHYDLRQIEEYMAYLKLKDLRVTYRTATLAAIKAFYNFLIEQEIIHRHPCRGLFISEKQPKGVNFDKLFSLEEMEQIFKVLPTRFDCTKYRNKALVGIMIYQGATSAEVMNMKLRQVDLEKGTVKIVGEGKNRNRTIALLPSQVMTLMRYIENERPNLAHIRNQYLFISMRGSKINISGIGSIFKKIQGAFDKRINPMIIRQSVISHWLNEKKFKLEDVQIMAGHRVPSTTDKYIKAERRQQREAVNKLCSSIFG
ncbi:MAG: hypothetical protein COB65_01515 [Thalassobium sp.]|nr:MAG: hypothetical protein COB65_01515 [Thalassobium sp.]